MLDTTAMLLTRPQLEVAANDVFYLAQEMFAYYSWMTRVEPRLIDLSTPLHKMLVQNAVIEAQLMFYRKLNEFFRRPNPRFPDDLKSELFGFDATGGFMNDADIEELHKRAAHPTTQQAVRGSVSYEIYDASYAALNHVIPFFTFLSEHFHTAGSSESRSLLCGVNVLRTLWGEWSSLVEPEKRKALLP
jgi:hypothetical protein